MFRKRGRVVTSRWQLALGSRAGRDPVTRKMDAKGKERGILKLEPRPRVQETRSELTPQTSWERSPASPQPSVDRLSVTWADPEPCSMASSVNLYPLPSEPASEVKFSSAAGDGSEDEDYSASLSAVLRQRRASVRRSRKGRARRPSSPFLPDEPRTRRRSSVFTTSSGDTAISMEESQPAVVTQEQIFENIHLHKEVLGSVKQQPLGMRRKLKLVHQAKAYIKKHEGQLQERLAQSKSTRDIYARFNILLNTKWQQMKREAANTSNLLIPWELRIKEIESHFGSVVASYFTFLRWLFWVNLVIAFILLVFVIVPECLTADKNQDGERKIIMEEDKDNATNLLTLWEFEGILKFSPIFYGYYSNVERPEYRMPLAYFLTGLVVYIYSFVAILRKMAENSRMSKLSEKEDECIFSWKLFTGWDFMIGNAETAHNRIASVILGFKEALLEEAEKKKDVRNWRIISLRALVNICVVILLVVSAYAVVTVVTRNDDNSKPRSWWSENQTTIVVTVISITFPVFFELLGFLEHYHPRKQLRLQLASKIDGMSKDLDALKPRICMNASVLPNSTMIINETLALDLPVECEEEIIACAPCNLHLTTFPLDLTAPTTTSYISSVIPISSTPAALKASTLSQTIMSKPTATTARKLLMGAKTLPMITTPLNSSVTTRANALTTTSTSLTEGTTTLSKPTTGMVSTENELLPQNLLEKTTTEDPVEKQKKIIQNLSRITADAETSESIENENDQVEYYNEDDSSETVKTRLDTSTDVTSSTLSTYFENFSSSTSYHTETDTDATMTESIDYTSSTENDVTLTDYISSTESNYSTLDNTNVTDVTLSETDSTITDGTISTAFESTMTEDTTISDSSSTNFDSAQENRNVDTTIIIEELSTPYTHIATDITVTTMSEEAETNEDITTSSSTDMSTDTFDTTTVCPDVSFNCTVNCDGRNVTQMFNISNCTVVQKTCYTRICKVQLHQEGNRTLDIQYTDKHQRKMYNLTSKTKRKLLKLCWETMFGQELVKLTMMDLVFVLLGTLFMDFFRALFVRYMNRCWCWDLEKKFPEYGDFKIAENILHLINNQGMVWMGMFFSPGLVVLNVSKLMIMMYLRSWAVMTCNVPHEVVFRVSKSNNFYLALLLTMLFLCVLPVGYTIVWVKPSWHCGPFSEYEKIYHILTSNIYKFLPKSLNFALEYMASPAIVIPLLVLLILIIYYLTSLTNSLREANNDLKIQLRRERTEERRKMFQLADTRRAGSSALDNTPFARWKKALPALPLNKSIDSDDRKTITEEGEPVKTAKKRGGLLAKIVGLALDKKTEESVSDDVPPSPNNVDEETDTDFHEALPKEVLKIKDIIITKPDKKRNNVEFKTEIAEKLKDNLKVKLDKDERNEKRPEKIKEVIAKIEVIKEVPPIVEERKEIEEKQLQRNQTTDSTTSKQSDSFGSVIPVITISTTESDDEVLHSKKETKNGKESKKERNGNSKKGKGSEVKSLRRQSSVDSANEQKPQKEKKEDVQKYQHSL